MAGNRHQKREDAKRQATVFVEALGVCHKFGALWKNKGGPLVENQYAYCKKEGH